MSSIADGQRGNGRGWAGRLVEYVVFGVTVASVLGIFSSILNHRDRIVRLEERTVAESGTLLEIKADVKELLRKENTRAGRESAAGVKAGGSSSSGSPSGLE